MGRILWIEKELENQVKFLIPKVHEVGLIIGQLTEAKDYAIHLARCPDPVDDEVEVEASNLDDAAFSFNCGRKERGKTKCADSEIDPKWILEHSRQVNRMLTGGLSILGVYMVSSIDLFSSSQAKLRQCLHIIQKKVTNNKLLRGDLPHNDRYLLHICASSGNFFCQSINITDDQASLRPVELCTQSFLNTWRCIKTCVDVNVNSYVPLCQELFRTAQKIAHACQSEIESIWDSSAVIGFKILDESQPLDKGEGKAGFVDEIDITLFKNSGLYNGKVIAETDSVISQVKFVGSIVAKAFLHPKATYGEAVKALKVDVIRSLLTRIELLSDEAEVNNLCHVHEWSLMSPARVFALYKDYNICFCDYIFKDESEEDSIGRFKELLNLPQSRLLFPEQAPDASVASIILGEKTGDHLSDVASEISNQCIEEPRSNKIVAVGVAAITALLAVTIHFFSN